MTSSDIATFLVKSLTLGYDNETIVKGLGELKDPHGVLFELNDLFPLEYNASDNLTFVSLIAQFKDKESIARAVIGLARLAPGYTRSEFYELIQTLFPVSQLREE